MGNGAALRASVLAPILDSTKCDPLEAFRDMGGGRNTSGCRLGARTGDYVMFRLGMSISVALLRVADRGLFYSGVHIAASPRSNAARDSYHPRCGARSM